MSKKALWTIIVVLVLINIVSFAFLLSKNVNGKDEAVAKIGDSRITRQQWLNELEKRYGQETLEDMINYKVVLELARKYGIKVDDKTIEREMKMFKLSYQIPEENVLAEDELKKKIRYSILLEELLTKDVNISEEELRKYYEEHKEQFVVHDAYHLSHIIVKTKNDAQKIIKELEGGSSFEALAAEQSIDKMTSKDGGDLGFIFDGDPNIPREYIEEAKFMEENEWSDPISLDNGYAIIFLREKVKGEQYKFDEVKHQIRRQLALEQMEGNVTARQLWDDIGVTWFYENKQNH